MEDQTTRVENVAIRINPIPDSGSKYLTVLKEELKVHYISSKTFIHNFSYLEVMAMQLRVRNRHNSHSGNSDMVEQCVTTKTNRKKKKVLPELRSTHLYHSTPHVSSHHLYLI